MTQTMIVECTDCGFENEVACETEYDDYSHKRYEVMSDDCAECEECGEFLANSGSSDYDDRMSERKQMGLSNF